MNKKLLIVLTVAGLIFSISGCSFITVEKIEMGVDAGENKDWDDLEDRFDILYYVPELADEVDYYCLKKGSSSSYEGVEIGFKEVDKPKKLANEIMEKLEDEGYEYVGDDCITNWAKTPEGQIEKDNYHCYNYSLSVDEDDYSRVAIFIEYFDNLYPNSHNVFLRITPEKNKAKSK